jgi:GNAT superfamily N-acetyltransferase
VNRAIGLGDRGRVDHAALAAVAARYRQAGVARAFIHLPRTAETPALAAACRAAGLRPARAWQKFIRLRSTRLPETAAIEIRPVEGGLEAAFARIACAAFDLGARAEAWLACLPRHAGWHGFVAIVDGEPAGTGALFVSAGVGWTDWGATAPRFRQRGIQRALLAHRLRLADAMGLARVHTCTGEAVPGDPQHSYANILRCGFVETALRSNWTTEPAGG